MCLSSGNNLEHEPDRHRGVPANLKAEDHHRDESPLTPDETKALKTLFEAQGIEYEPERLWAVQHLQSRNQRLSVATALVALMSSAPSSVRISAAEALQGSMLPEIKEPMLTMLTMPVNYDQSDRLWYRQLDFRNPPPQLLAAIALAKDGSKEVSDLVNQQFSAAPRLFVDVRHLTPYTYDLHFFSSQMLDYIGALLDPRENTVLKDRIALALQHDFSSRGSQLPAGLQGKLEAAFVSNYFQGLISGLGGSLRYVVEPANDHGPLGHLSPEVDRLRQVSIEPIWAPLGFLSAPNGVRHLRALPLDDRIRVAGALLFVQGPESPLESAKDFLLKVFEHPKVFGGDRVLAASFISTLAAEDSRIKSALEYVASGQEIKSAINHDPYLQSSKPILFAGFCLARLKACE